jgi:hypothetical protein
MSFTAAAVMLSLSLATIIEILWFAVSIRHALAKPAVTFIEFFFQ